MHAVAKLRVLAEVATVRALADRLQLLEDAVAVMQRWATLFQRALESANNESGSAMPATMQMQATNELALANRRHSISRTGTTHIITFIRAVMLASQPARLLPRPPPCFHLGNYQIPMLTEPCVAENEPTSMFRRPRYLWTISAATCTEPTETTLASPMALPPDFASPWIRCVMNRGPQRS